MPPSDAKLNIGIQIVLFGLTVAMAVHSRWSTTDLVWSLWISSLTVGYSLILTSIVGTFAHASPLVLLTRKPGAGASGGAAGQIPSGVAALPLNIFIAIVCVFTLGVTRVSAVILVVLAASSALAIGGVLRSRQGWELFPDPERGVARFLIALPGALFMLGFFTFHFGLFHFVHGLFLNGFFPLVRRRRSARTPSTCSASWGRAPARRSCAFGRSWLRARSPASQPTWPRSGPPTVR